MSKTYLDKEGLSHFFDRLNKDIISKKADDLDLSFKSSLYYVRKKDVANEPGKWVELPAADPNSFGCIKLGFNAQEKIEAAGNSYDANKNRDYPVDLYLGKAFVNVPWEKYNLVGAKNTTGLIKNGSEVTSSSGYIAAPIIGGIPYYKNTTYSVVGAKNTTGLIKNGSDVTNSSGYIAAPIISGIPYYKDTTYGVVGNSVGNTGLIKNGSGVTDVSSYTPAPLVGGIPYYKDTTYGLASNTAGLIKNISKESDLSGYLASPVKDGVPYYKNTTYTLKSFGVNASATELNYCDGVTSSIQTQLNNKSDKGHTHQYAGSDSVGGSANSAKGLVENKLGSENLNTLHGSNKVYYASGSNSVTNKPENIDAFGLFTMKDAEGYTAQIIASSNQNPGLYFRSIQDNNPSGVWHKLAYKSEIPEKYTLQQATTNSLGGIKLGFAENLEQKNYPVQLKNGQAFVHVPWNDLDTKYGLVGAKNSTGLVKNGSDLTTIDSDYTPTPIINGVPYYKNALDKLPVASVNKLGGIQLGFTQIDKKYPVQLDGNKAYVEVPWKGGGEVEIGKVTPTNNFPKIYVNTAKNYTTADIFIKEAPSDGKQYIRQNKNWNELTISAISNATIDALP